MDHLCKEVSVVLFLKYCFQMAVINEHGKLVIDLFISRRKGQYLLFIGRKYLNQMYQCLFVLVNSNLLALNPIWDRQERVVQLVKV